MKMASSMNRKKECDCYLAETDKMIIMKEIVTPNHFFCRYFGSDNVTAIFILLFSISVYSCSTKNDTIPDDIIPRQEMIAVLIDVQEIEAKIQTQNLGMNDSTKNIALNYYNDLFKRHHIKSSDFKKSFSYYVNHLDLLNKMYEEVITGISKKQAETAGKHKL